MYFPVSRNFPVSRTGSGKFPVSGKRCGIPFWKDPENGTEFQTFQNLFQNGSGKMSGKFPNGNRNPNSGGNPTYT